MIIRLGAMGDVVRTLPGLRALRTAYPEAYIRWLVEHEAAGVLSGQAGLDGVMHFPRELLTSLLEERRFGALWRELRTFVETLRAERFDLVIDFHSILKSGVLARLSGARTRVSYAKPYSREFSGLFANQRARLSPSKMSRYDRTAGLIQFLAIDPEVPGPLLEVAAAARARMTLELKGEAAPALIHPGSSSGAIYKRYRPSGYAGLARDLLRSRGVDSIVTLGTTAEERAIADEIVAASDGAARLAPETPSLADLVALIERACLFIGSDSGPLHIATALGTPAVQILGPTDPIENEPRRGSNWERARVCVPCSPCRRGCVQATCMTMIPHELVLSAALKCLDDARDPVRDLRARPSPSYAVGAVP